MPPETSEVDFYTENESEIEIKQLTEDEYFSADIHEFRKQLNETDDTESDFPEPRRSKLVLKKKYKCEQCSEDFRRKTQFDRHVFKHTGIKIHKCTLENCDKEFIISTALKRHIHTYHLKERGERKFKCTVPSCDKAFDSVFNLERHCKRRHESPVTYKCDICNHEFQRKIKLKFHVVTAHTKEYPFHCEKCGKKFITEHTFKKHKCKTYTCDVCNASFQKWSMLCQHRKSSSNCALRYKCKECNKEFRYPLLLEAHEQMHKSTEEREGFKCTFEECGKFYTMKKNLDAHFRRKHGDLKDAFKCSHEGCGQILSTKKKLEDHINIMHISTHVRPKKAGPRNQRKDAGKKKKILEALTGIVIPNNLEKKILDGAEIEFVEDSVDGN